MGAKSVILVDVLGVFNIDKDIFRLESIVYNTIVTFYISNT